MKSMTLRSLLLVCLLGVFPALAVAEGNLAVRAERLDPLKLNAVEGFSIKTYEIETGRFYRWRIESDGREEYKLLAPELWRHAWIDQVVIEDKEVKPFGLHAVEFDDEGIIDIFFLVIRPGTYPFYVEHLRSQGFEGRFVVK
jgi:hypothetical protein